LTPCRSKRRQGPGAIRSRREEREEHVATYVALVNWTEKGIAGFKDTAKRADAFGELVKKHGGTLQSIHWTLGNYDIVAIVQVKDDETMTAVALEVGAIGNIRTTTLRAFDRKQIQAIIKKTS
jgi:uncharacterized protein with GYD domain